jgi:hypothetical protein
MGRLLTRASGGAHTDGNAVGAEEVRQLKDILAPPIEPGLSKIAHLSSLRPRTNSARHAKCSVRSDLI